LVEQFDRVYILGLAFGADVLAQRTGVFQSSQTLRLGTADLFQQV